MGATTPRLWTLAELHPAAASPPSCPNCGAPRRGGRCDYCEDPPPRSLRPFEIPDPPDRR